MFTKIALSAVLALMPLDVLKNDLVRAQLIGTWRELPIETSESDESGPEFVITRSTMSLIVGGEVVWAANYRVDASKKPVRVYQTVTQAPCFCGASPELEQNVTFAGKDNMDLGGMLLKRVYGAQANPASLIGK